MDSNNKNFYFKHHIEIDGLRGLSIMLVILGHVSQRLERFCFDRGEIGSIARYIFDTVGSSASGVYLFFSISGFLIAQSFTNIKNINAYDMCRFYTRRLFRIVPPFLFMLCSTWLALSLSGWVPQRTNQFQTQPASLTESLLASAFFLHQIVYGTMPRLFPPGWSLEVEVHFYILSPLLCIGFTRLVKWMGLGAASALTLSVGSVVALVFLASGIERLQHSLPVFIPLFLLGIVANTVWQDGWRPSLRLMPGLGLPAFIAFAALQPWIAGAGMEVAIRMLMIAIMFSALASGRGVFFRLCTHPVVAQIGIVSYSAYLVHMQVVQSVFILADSYFKTFTIIEMFFIVVFSIFMIVFITISFYMIVEKPLRCCVFFLMKAMTPLSENAFHRRKINR